MLKFHQVKRYTMSLAAIASLLFVIQVDAKSISKTQNTKQVTADDQVKGSRNDVELTRRVREEITKNDNLSVQAHNIKIITLNGVMTLRGAVKSMDERNQISNIAKSVATDVRNEIEITK